jgi:hypothetical protein
VGEYDIALKSILTRGDGSLLARLTGRTVARWINVELPDVRGRQADLLGETPEGGLVHVELQSTNDSRMPARMLDYATAIYRRFDRFPRQLVLYVGQPRLAMTSELVAPDISFRFAIVDIRELDGEELIAGDRLEDNLLGILGRLSDHPAALRRILAKINEGRPETRYDALKELTILARLRNLVSVLEEETKRMPILEDIMDHEIIGRERKLGMALGRVEGQRNLVLSLISELFGTVPEWARRKIESLGEPELEVISRRLLKPTSLAELLA